MSIRILDNVSISVGAGLSPSAITFPISVSDAAILNNMLAVGDIVYLVATDSMRQEVMMYTHNAVLMGTPPQITVARGKLGTTAKTWGVNTCLRTTLTEGVISALICQKIAQGC